MKNFTRTRIYIPFDCVCESKRGSILSTYWFIDDLIKIEVNLKRASRARDISCLQKKKSLKEPVCTTLALVTACTTVYRWRLAKFQMILYNKIDAGNKQETREYSAVLKFHRVYTTTRAAIELEKKNRAPRVQYWYFYLAFPRTYIWNRCKFNIPKMMMVMIKE